MSSRDDLRAHQRSLCAVQTGKDAFGLVPQVVPDAITRHGTKVQCRQANSVECVKDTHEVATLNCTNIYNFGRILTLELLRTFHELAFRNHLLRPPAADSTRAVACARTE